MIHSGWDELPFEPRHRSKLVFSLLLVFFIKMKHSCVHEDQDPFFRPQMPEWLRLEVGNGYDERRTYTIPDFPRDGPSSFWLIRWWKNTIVWPVILSSITAFHLPENFT